MLYFGSFNPVHRGHIAIAEHVIERDIADMVVMVVSPQNPFKQTGSLAPELERFEGAEAAAAASKYPSQIQASAVEMALPKPSYTINTLRFLTERFPEKQFSILMGEDNAAGLTGWREADKIIGHYPIYVYPRSGGAAPGRDVGDGSHEGGEPAKFPAGVTVLDNAPLFDVSSTAVRELLESGRNHHRANRFGAAANDFARVLALAPANAEAAGYLELIEEILNYRNTDLLNP
ncbi:MAG: nicotinate-nicotinamide nucleotide adenylyltransferase [Alistipes sp.]|nr:nicotinate-nicotinamide nucleotide adenylyltransferase [Alistipes sp.]